MVSNSSQQELYTGCVKWFNSKTGFGFITVINDCDYKNMDVFVHHTSINVSDKTYKYLVQGEYVEFNIQKLENTSDKKHEVQAVNIRGIFNNDLMCETRNKNNQQSNNFTTIRKSRPRVSVSS
jgi:cold shock CspA family protein